MINDDLRLQLARSHGLCPVCLASPCICASRMTSFWQKPGPAITPRKKEVSKNVPTAERRQA